MPLDHLCNTAVQSQKAVSVYFTSKQILSFGIAEQNTHVTGQATAECRASHCCLIPVFRQHLVPAPRSSRLLHQLQSLGAGDQVCINTGPASGMIDNHSYNNGPSFSFISLDDFFIQIDNVEDWLTIPEPPARGGPSDIYSLRKYFAS